MRKILFIILILGLFFPSFILGADENLDEIIDVRKARKSTNTFYSGETASPDYIRQPQTLIYYDLVSGSEVLIWTQTNDKKSFASHEYGGGPNWSADGKRFSFLQNVATAAFNYSTGYKEIPWYVGLSDGTSIRPQPESSRRTGYGGGFYFDWSPTERDIYYATGFNYNGNSGLDLNQIYKHTVTDTSVSRETWVDLIPADTSTQIRSVKHAITGDGKYILHMGYIEQSPIYIGRLDSPNQALVLTYAIPSFDSYWWDAGTQPWDGFHDEYFVNDGADGYWIYCLSTSGSWWRFRPWGTDSGAPDHTVDNSSPYDWWEGTDAQKEIQPINGKTGTAPWASQPYWSHMAAGQWGGKVVYSNVVISGTPATFNADTNTAIATTSGKGALYHTWTGFTDFVNGASSGDGVGLSRRIYRMKYDDAATFTVVADLHNITTGDFIHPSQSPDGTKVSALSDWLNPTSGIGDIFITISHYPYPPEVYQANGTGASLNLRFDWGTNSATWRGYTARKWPNETTGEYLIPRETDKFRLWVSTDNTAWTPVTTANATPFTKYNFSAGGFIGGQTSYWEINTTQGVGTTRYYAVTAIETSGLESKALSNTWKVILDGAGDITTQVQESAYPASPGGNSAFYATLPSQPQTLIQTHQKAPATATGQYTVEWTEPVSTALVRHYNIYALDNNDPTAIQQRRIASISRNICSGGACSWVDWLGNTAENTNYGITSVDTLGNESVIKLTGDPPAYKPNITIGGGSLSITGGGSLSITW